METIVQNIQGVPLNHYILFCSIIFAIGVMGVLIRRNVIIIMMSVELMLNSVNLLLTAFSVHHGDPAGQVFVFFIMALAAAEVAVGLAIIVMVYRNTRSVDINALNRLRG
ncbi:NADH-quinone oxidoreductase subunit NuoK [Parapedobacter sp. 10938]|uniref:NADH-quinone oxidoreductase subunit NuoK n=1 Tax=Parapedobacter flavus TaxID=3110225 RepID=UPI002DBE12E8|nr:NADH-quinone oxidoreductase subunit NuoK [Parapedobacter sp. 10938]MEC3880752.1 NADH-quinone oxidoreductase subunit NuoK [Parapedobacter sp. 10938]